MEIIFLGTSSLDSIPRLGDKCPQCTSGDPRDIRSRSAILINKKILIDAGPDILAQIPREWLAKIKTVFLTHSHEDVVGGLAELLKKGTFKVYLSKETLRDLRKIFKFSNFQIFNQFANNQVIKDKEVVRVGFEKVQAILVPHSKNTATFGYLINNKFLYIQDIKNLKPILPVLKKIKVVAVDGSMFARDFGGHQAMVKTIKMLKTLKNLKEIYFTHNGHTRIPHAELEKKVKNLGDDRFKVAYDLLEIKL